MNDIDLQYYGQYAESLREAERILLDELTGIIGECSHDEEQSPAEHIRSRIKSAESMREKLARLDVPATAENAISAVNDAVGIRVVTHFIGDVYTILHGIEASPRLEVRTIKDYISKPKKNGYRSLHVIVRLELENGPLESLNSEIQLRTIAMDCWASLEHQMKYKKSVSNADLIVSELRRCADEMASTDLTMQTIRQMILDGQS